MLCLLRRGTSYLPEKNYPADMPCGNFSFEHHSNLWAGSEAFDFRPGAMATGMSATPRALAPYLLLTVQGLSCLYTDMAG